MENVRVLICGSRFWDNESRIKLVLQSVMRNHSIVAVIEGEQRGADVQGRDAAKKLGIPVLPYPANWLSEGNAAGNIRNRWMLEDGKPDLIIAFHNNIENSKGTKDMINISKKAGLPVLLVTDITIERLK